MTLTIPAPGPALFPRVPACLDYKPSRPLTGVAATRIDTLVPGVRFIDYRALPFLGELEHLMGVDTGTPRATYVRRRDGLFHDAPMLSVPLAGLVVTQQWVNVSRVDELVTDPTSGLGRPVCVVEHAGRLHVLNGHHRLAASHQLGLSSVPARVLRWGGGVSD